MASIASYFTRFFRSSGPPRPSKIQKPSLSSFVANSCVPRWFEAFSDPAGGFYERLDSGFHPVDPGYKRLLTQCRQIYIYIHADAGTGRYLPRLTEKYEFLKIRYRQPQGGWSFSIGTDGRADDSHLDLYGHAFLILALSQYAKAANSAEAARLASETAELIERHFKIADGPGFYEALNPDFSPIERLRRQNPHMHLFEACLFAYDTLRDDVFARLAHGIYALFRDYFFDAGTGTLGEFFDAGLRPDPARGDEVEAGHHFEWVWLLDYYRRLFPAHDAEAFSFMEKLYDWGCRYGYDTSYGGIYDVQSRNGSILKDTKRVWPLCEAIKAHRAMRPYRTDAIPYLKATKKIFRRHYLRKDTGWNESWNREFTVRTVDYLPGTSVYHL